MGVKLTNISITDCEWHVMEEVWRLGKATASEIIAGLEEQKTPWASKTIGTFISRLAEKGALRYRRVGRGYVYEAAVTREDCLLRDVAEFMEHIGKKGFAPLLKLYIAYHRPRAKEMEELRKALKQGKK
jgi:predicted transcriptional regulator